MTVRGVVCGILAVVLISGGCSKKPRRDAADELHYAVRNGDLGQVQVLIAQGSPVDAHGPWGRTLLDEALRRGHNEIIQLLVAKAEETSAGIPAGGTKKQ